MNDGMRHRIESCTSSFHVRWMELLRDLPGNRCGVQVRRFADDVVATAVTSTPDEQWMQHVSGLRDGDEALVPKIAAWYHSLAIRPRYEIAPVAAFERLALALTDARAVQTAFLDALWSRAFEPSDEPVAGVEVRVVEPRSTDADVFARVLLGGHEVPDTAYTEHWAAAATWCEEPEWWCYLACCDGEPLGAAVLVVDDGIGYLANASTLPRGRRRGCQRALIDRRLRDARRAGCELFVSLATPFTTSHRNLERAGLTVAYTKTMWTVTGP